MPRGHLLFLSPKTVNKKSVSAESASLKIGYTPLKVRNLLPLCYSFKQTDFLRSVSPIFLTLTSQGGNQGILRSTSYLFKRSRKYVFSEIRDRLRPIHSTVSFNFSQTFTIARVSNPQYKRSPFLENSLSSLVILTKSKYVCGASCPLCTTGRL